MDIHLEVNVDRPLCLLGVTGEFKGRSWKATGTVRVGRVGALEVLLDDDSVSRCHAELSLSSDGWHVADLGSTNGTWVSGARVGRVPVPFRARDLLQFGEVVLLVESAAAAAPDSADQLQVEGATRTNWEEALLGLAFDEQRRPRPGEQVQALLRAGQHLGRADDEEQLLRAILDDAVGVLDAQRGAIALADGPADSLVLRSVVSGRGRSEFVTARHAYSKSLARRCLERGESILCRHAQYDSELAGAVSIAEGAMASVLCVLLRTPRKRLGVLHLDRGPWQPAFTMDDLHLADALAASVSAGIESMQLLRQQRNLFLNTITALAQVVELRDEYTGGHTARVTSYSLLLGAQLGLDAEQMDWLRIGGPLHDIGKIGIDDAVLRKPGRLSDQEFEVMKQHTVRGAEIVERVPELRSVLPIVRSHHERWDGDGYPDRLCGDAIPYTARILAVADTFDAMTSDRPYRKGMSTDTALDEIGRQAGRQFDPKCVESFLAIRDELMTEKQRPSVVGTRVVGRRFRTPSVPCPPLA